MVDGFRVFLNMITKIRGYGEYFICFRGQTYHFLWGVAKKKVYFFYEQVLKAGIW